MATGNRRTLGWATLLLIAGVVAIVLWPRAPERPRDERSTAGESPAARDASLRPSPGGAPTAASAPERREPASATAAPGQPSKEGAGLSGRVVEDPSGAVLAGARVRVWETRNSLKGGARTTVTDARGEFTFADLPSDVPFAIVADAPDHIARRVLVPVGGPRTERVVSLQTGAILEGDVRDGSGALLPDVRVFALERHEPLPPRDRPHQWLVFDAQIEQVKAGQPSCVTDARGHFEIRGVALGLEITAVVQKSDRLEARSDPATFSQPGERIRRDVRLVEPGEILVRAASSTEMSQVDVQGATVWFSAEKEERREDGAFLMSGLTPGPYLVRVWSQGRPSQEQETRVEAGKRVDVVFAASVGGHVEGVVVDESGRPLRRTHVWWLGSDTVMGQTDEEGRFRLEGIVDATGRVQVHAPMAFDEPPLVGTTIEGVVPGREPLRIVLRRSPVVFGRLMGIEPGTQMRSTFLSKSSGGSDSRPVEDGRFERPTGEAHSRALLVFERDGFAPLIAEVPALEPGARHDLGNLEFSRGRTVSGVVRGENGDPIAGATILVAEKWIEASRVTAPDGSYRFEHMPDRAAEIRVNVPERPVHIVVLPAGAADTTFDVRVDTGGLLKLTVLDAEGRPVPNAEVMFAPDGDHPYDVDFDKTGRLRPANADGVLEARLQARGHFVRVFSPDGKRHGEIESLKITKGETTAVEVRLR